VPVEETVGALAELIAEGSIGAIGLSNHPAALLERGAAVAPIAVVQHQWNLLDHGPEASDAAGWAARNGARFLAWSPLASGFLVDGFALDELHADDLRRRLRWARPPDAERVDRLRQAAAELGTGLRELALGWAARTGHPIVGARSPEELHGVSSIRPLDDVTAAVLEGAAR